MNLRPFKDEVDKVCAALDAGLIPQEQMLSVYASLVQLDQAYHGKVSEAIKSEQKEIW